ncbi:hypothetical protein KQI88_15820 [Alkaliphilus sp. MSJ-5]|uniref:RING-type domain-containing protein n=1 Tax=Alkaliphilus flagellatus TaxID=2841507 RepID=A0ABS6G5W7_9FIRM|nr:hypothetical protein [Alkaliphilus flagellatus]MBU5677886.1 hypothetical protein [Alkaliphilus flagellatus]
MEDKIVVTYCDHCSKEIYKGEQVKLCDGGHIVHEKCLQAFAIELVCSITITVEELKEDK